MPAPSTDIKDYKQKAAQSLAAARAVNQRALDEGRELTDSEDSQVNSHLDDAERFEKRAKQLERLHGWSSEPTIGDSVETEEEEEVGTVAIDTRDSSERADREDREDHDADMGYDPYNIRWDRRGSAEQFRDMSISRQREYLRLAATRDYNMAFYAHLRARGVTNEQVSDLFKVRTMVEGTDADGGYLAPTQLVAGIIREAQVYEQLKPRMEVIRSNARSLTYTKGLDNIVMGWVAELGTKPEDQVTIGRVVLVPHVGAVVVWVSDELLEDETFGLQNYLSTLVGEAKVVLEEEAFISGSGSGRPWGILTRLNAEGGTPNRYTTQAAGTLSAEDIIRIPYSMPYRYRRQASWVFGTNALRSIRLLRDGSGASANTGQFLWQPGLQAGEPSTLNGQTVIESDAVGLNGTVSTGNDVGIYGNLRRYRVFERLGLQVKRLEELRALTDEVGFRFRFRTGGDVMLNAAFRSIRVQ